MTTPADDRAVEEAFEAALTGRPVPDGACSLVAFTDAVRADAAAPGRPTAALAELLATGLLTTHQEPSPGTAGHPARTSRKRPRMLFTALIAKIASAGAVAKAAAGTGAVVVALAGATTAGALTSPEGPSPVVETAVPAGTAGTDEAVGEDPDVPADDAVENAPSEDTPDTGDDTTGDDTTGDDTTGDDTTGDDAAGDDAAGDDGAGDDAPADEQPQPVQEDTEPAHPENFGARVSADARDGGVDGSQISAEAHARNEARKKAREAARNEAPEVEDEAPEVEEAEEETAEAVPAPAAEPRGNAGQSGNGRGHGNGNGKN
ncbi:hypothetical protein ACI79C_21840 [Geodermatophilus sp. SYSU D00697]